uniref:sphinganine-1-phosphate aldolase n=1 Tax=Macrostomum lignano TaxID=282301 RepID=A0A1I8HZM7_9PLAT
MDPILDSIKLVLEDARSFTNASFAGMDAASVCLITFGATVLLCSIINFLCDPEYTLLERMRTSFFKFVKSLPPVKKQIQAKKRESVVEVKKAFEAGHSSSKHPVFKELPKKSMTPAEVMAVAADYKAASVNWTNGSVSGTVYHGGEELTDLNAKVYKEFAWTNPLHPEVFNDVRRMEAEVVSMTCQLFNGDEEACGCAAHYLRIRIVHVPSKPDGRVDVAAMRSAINKNTCMLVGSTPSYSHGIIDPIGEIAKLGLKYGVPVHVDACLGGFLLPFMEQAGFPLEPVDFRVPGVTSISCDTHKYAFAPKGSSVLLYRNAEYRKQQFFSYTGWCGGFYASPTMPGSRPGAVIAACWATLLHFGVEGYVDATKKIVGTARKIKAGVQQIEGVKLMGDPQMSVIGIGSDHFSAYRLADALKEKGWSLNMLQKPASFHICCTYVHTQPGVAERLIEDIHESAAALLKDPTAKDVGMGAIYGTAQKIPDPTIVDDIAMGFLDVCLSV